MHIWVDADACPKAVKEILFRAAQRVECYLTLVANQPLHTPPSKWINSLQVSAGFDMADHTILQRLQAGDLVITADIPLASEVIAKQGKVINPRGEQFTRDNIGQRLSMRNAMDTLRSSGIHTGGPAAYSQQDKQAFANQLDRMLSQR
jgi:uncharacterized protein YaiI (UPF0178 family)